ncbi:MAG: response regulator [Lachnospiraceae bacterium]|nr:response regulator [Lachnospiraceae bacterium]
MIRKKILAVDDNSISLATIEQVLKEKYDVMPLNSGVRALQYLKKGNRPALILLDVRMAAKDGIETLREIREMESCRNIPVIMLSSQNDKQTVLESLVLGADSYILKPFNRQDLYDRIESVLHKGR